MNVLQTFIGQFCPPFRTVLGDGLTVGIPGNESLSMTALDSMYVIAKDSGVGLVIEEALTLEDAA